MITLTKIAKEAETAPVATLPELAGSGEILVLAPHPDDESLAMGAALCKASDAGRRVHVVVVTDGTRSHPNSISHPSRVLSALRRDEVRAAVSILTRGRTEPIWLGYPDMAAPESEDEFCEIARRLEPQLENVSAIWTTWDGDPHPDHQRVWRLARYLATGKEGVHMFGCPLWGRVQEPVPHASSDGLRRLQVKGYHTRKSQAVAAHKSQMTKLIGDDPEGFTMPPELAAYFVSSDELFIPA